MKKLFSILIFLALNNSLSAQFNIYIPIDTITFEETYPYIELDSAVQNIWQIGQPQKVFFDAAYSSPNAIVTDTINNYTMDNYSYFDLKIGEFNYPGMYGANVFLEIKHKYDTDTFMDGGYITVSYDTGQTWVNIIEDTEVYWCNTPMSNNWNLYSYFDTLSNGELGFSGKSDGWVTTQFGWALCPVKSNSNFDFNGMMLVRFNFLSDSINNNKEGWLIDDIVLYGIEMGNSTHQLEHQQFKLYPNPILKTATIELDAYYNNIELNIYNFQGQFIRQEKYPNSENLNFDSQGLEQGIYFLKIKADGKEIGGQKVVVGR